MSTTVEAPAGRECLLGGETKRRGIFGGTGWKGFAGIFVYGAVAAFAVVTTRSILILALAGLVPLLVWAASSRITGDGDSWAGQLMDRLVAAVGHRTGATSYAPEIADDGLTVLPREVGRVEFVGVAPEEGRAELSVVRHGASYFSSTLEIVGGGDGLRERGEVDRFGLKFGRLLFAVSRPTIPVDQLDMSTRVVPVDPTEYYSWVEEHLDPNAQPLLADNLRELAGRVEQAGEAYRTFLTLSMPMDQLQRKAQQRGPVNIETLAAAAYEATGEVAREATRQGFVVRQGLTPARLAALIRHQYAPSYGIDDATGLDGPRTAFPPYRAHREGVEVFAPDGTSWWHATAGVPRDGWPLRPVSVRFLEGLVTDITPSMMRTVSVQHRLQPKAATRTKAVLANTGDQAELLAQEKRGQTSTGEREAQEAGSKLVLHDLLYESATGDMPQLRVTVSGRTRGELLAARQQMEAAMQDCDFSRIRWYDHRHHHAHLLTLPMGRGGRR